MLHEFYQCSFSCGIFAMLSNYISSQLQGILHIIIYFGDFSNILMFQGNLIFAKLIPTET